MPIPTNFGQSESSLQRRYFGMPLWLIISGGAVLVGSVLFLRKKKATTQAQQSQNYQAPSQSQAQQAGYSSGVYDTSNQLPWEMTWPYNQLALPYNYSGATESQVSANTQYLLPQQPNFVGQQVTPYSYAATYGQA